MGRHPKFLRWFKIKDFFFFNGLIIKLKIVLPNRGPPP